MKLEISDTENNLDYNFGKWLIHLIQSKFISSIDSKKLIQWDRFFEKNDDYKIINNQKIVTKNILISGIKCLICTKTPDKIVIQLNPNQFISGFDRIKVDAIFRLVTFGNQQINGYPLFIQILQEIADNINDYVDMYLGGF